MSSYLGECPSADPGPQDLNPNGQHFLKGASMGDDIGTTLGLIKGDSRS